MIFFFIWKFKINKINNSIQNTNIGWDKNSTQYICVLAAYRLIINIRMPDTVIPNEAMLRGTFNTTPAKKRIRVINAKPITVRIPHPPLSGVNKRREINKQPQPKLGRRIKRSVANIFINQECFY